MPMRSMLGRVRGLGSAKDGVHHWQAQRLTAAALIPLTLWFVASVISLAGADYAAVKAWVGSPVSAALLIALVVATFHHAGLGLQTVIEDYVHGEGVKLAALAAVKGGCFLLGAVAVISVLKLAIGG